jgi:outer membrane protein assembly factor BamB
MDRMMTQRLLLALLLACPAALAQPAPEAARLHDAAGRGAIDEVRELLAAGVDVDAPTEYGATALLFAAGRGQVEVVRLLLEAGADPNARDRFYNATPVTWAGTENHAEVVLALLEGGADPGAVLEVGAATGGSEIVRAALARGPLSESTIEAAREAAREAGQPEIVALLEAAATRPDDPPPPLTAERAATYLGAYEDEEGARVSVTGDAEGVSLTMGGETRRLAHVGEDRLRAAGEPAWEVSFFGRSGMIEGLAVRRGEERTVFRTVGPGLRAEGSPGVEIGPVTPAPAGRWPAFRGANATGVASGPAPPATWNVETGENVLWVAEIPGRGHSSPIVWDGRVFLTTAVAEGEMEVGTGLSGDVGTIDDEAVHTWKVLALDAATGESIWQRDAGSRVPEFERHWKSTQANSTPATDGRSVVAVFPSLGLVCYDVDGELQWRADAGELDVGWFYDPSYEWGFGSSPVFHDGLVILQADVEREPHLAAWEAATGRPVWRVARADAVPGWSTPAAIRAGGRTELVTNGRTIRAYDPATGEELWSLGPNSELPIATPLVAGGAVFVSAGYPPIRPIYAIRPGGRGDLSGGRHVLWSHDRGGAYMPTPILHGGLLHVVHHDGRIEAYDPATGERVFRERFSAGGTFTASPVAAGEHLYFATEEGSIYTARAGREWSEIAVNSMGEAVMATPAIADGVLYVRTLTRLYAIGAPPGD